jgi:hypothetical protein
MRVAGGKKPPGAMPALVPHYVCDVAIVFHAQARHVMELFAGSHYGLNAAGLIWIIAMLCKCQKVLDSHGYEFFSAFEPDFDKAIDVKIIFNAEKTGHYCLHKRCRGILLSGCTATFIDSIENQVLWAWSEFNGYAS